MTKEYARRWAAKQKAALALEIIPDKTTAAEAIRSFDSPPSEVEKMVDEAKRSMENTLTARPLKI